MSSKKYKGKTCVYCGESASDGPDHVFAREFFLESERSNLPKVPACRDCNCQKSALEHYATTVLPFGARHPAALDNLQTMVPKRLARNAKLSARIREGMRRVLVEEPNGLTLPAGVVPVDVDRIEALFGMVGRGLLWHHFHTLLEVGDVVSVSVLNGAGEHYFETELFGPFQDQLLMRNYGHDTVIYQGIQAADCPRGSVWRIKIYGGLQFASSSGSQDAIASTIGVITGPADVEVVTGGGPTSSLNRNT